MLIHRAAARLSYGLTNYRHPEREGRFRLVSETAARIGAGGTTPLECMTLFQIVASCEKVPGDIAEAGVFRGATAALMLSASTKKLHLFDTFEGLPGSENQFEKGEWKGAEAVVRSNLSKWSNRVDLHPGFFPESAQGLEDLRFSFVHLDLDLYQSTRDAIAWFWLRLNPGGILLSHDYPLSEGVVRAFREHFDRLGNPVIPLSGNQCIVVKGGC